MDDHTSRVSDSTVVPTKASYGSIAVGTRESKELDKILDWLVAMTAAKDLISSEDHFRDDFPEQMLCGIRKAFESLGLDSHIHCAIMTQ